MYFYFYFLLDGYRYANFESKSSPHLVISVCNSQGRPVEPPREIDAPALVRKDSIWWGYTWQMHTPLQNIGDDFSIVIRLYYGNKKSIAGVNFGDHSPSGSNAVLTAKYRIEKDKIDTGKTVFSFSQANTEPFESEPKNNVRMSILKSPSAPPSPIHRESVVENLLEAEFEITKLFRKIDLDQIGTTPSPATTECPSKPTSERSSLSEIQPFKPSKPSKPLRSAVHA